MPQKVSGNSTDYTYFLLGAFTGVLGNTAATALWDLAAGKNLNLWQLIMFVVSIAVLVVVYIKFISDRKPDSVAVLEPPN